MQRTTVSRHSSSVSRHSYRLIVKTTGAAAAESLEFDDDSPAGAVCRIERMPGDVEVEIVEDGRRLGVMRRMPGTSPSWMLLP